MRKMHIKNIQKLLELREILDKALYPGHTLMTYDLILEILKAHLEGKSLTIKELSAGSHKSILNTRKHLNLLIDGGWIKYSNGVHDKRLRLINASHQLIHLVDKLLDKLD